MRFRSEIADEVLEVRQYLVDDVIDGPPGLFAAHAPFDI